MAQLFNRRTNAINAIGWSGAANPDERYVSCRWDGGFDEHLPDSSYLGARRYCMCLQPAFVFTRKWTITLIPEVGSRFGHIGDGLNISDNETV